MPHGVMAATRKVWPEKALTFVVVVARIELFCGREWRENVQPLAEMVKREVRRFSVTQQKRNVLFHVGLVKLIKLVVGHAGFMMLSVPSFHDPDWCALGAEDEAEVFSC